MQFNRYARYYLSSLLTNELKREMLSFSIVRKKLKLET